MKFCKDCQFMELRGPLALCNITGEKVVDVVTGYEDIININFCVVERRPNNIWDILFWFFGSPLMCGPNARHFKLREVR